MNKVFNKVVSRLKNPKVFVAVISGISLILLNLGLIDVAMSDKVTEITNIILGIGVSVGIFGNPDSHIKEVE